MQRGLIALCQSAVEGYGKSAPSLGAHVSMRVFQSVICDGRGLEDSDRQRGETCHCAVSWWSLLRYRFSFTTICSWSTPCRSWLRLFPLPEITAVDMGCFFARIGIGKAGMQRGVDVEEAD